MSENSDLIFNISPAKSYHVPHVKDPVFCVVIRKKVRATAIGPNTIQLQKIGKDIGKYNYIDSVPEVPLDSNLLFKELYNIND